MKVAVIQMRRNGVRIPKYALQRELAHDGELLIRVTQDNRLNRLSKTATLQQEGRGAVYELMDAEIVWMNDDNFVLAGFESRKNEADEIVDYAQSWLCLLGAGRRLKTESEEYEERQAKQARTFVVPTVFPPGR